MDPKERAREFFSRYASAYTENPSHRAGEDLRRLVAHLALDGRGRWLDVATGSGHTALALAPWVEEVIGLDLTPAMVAEFQRQARARGISNARGVLGSADALPFPDRSFDGVTCRRAAHHFPDLPQALAEMRRVLAPGGKLGIADMLAPEDPHAARWMNDLERIRDPSHQRALSLGEWKQRIQAIGLRLIAIEVVEEILPWEQWWFPVPLDSEAAAEARAYVARAGPEAQALRIRSPEGIALRKARGIVVAVRPPAP